MPSDQGAPAKSATQSGGASLEPGDVFADRFLVEATVGRGGMGAVYRVRDRLVDETLALKILIRPSGGLGAIAGDLFKREVRLARRITHPHVVRIHDLGERGDCLYLTMELVDGHDLRRELDQCKRLDVARAASVCAAVASGLEAAHAAGVVHRDLKPENVLLDRSGRVLVSDFGIARAVGGEASEEGRKTAGVVGTLPYMAPEQLEGGAIGSAVDVYALGLLLFETVVGEPAFTGPTPFAAAVARLQAPPPDLRQRRSVPDALSDLVRRCLARDPTLRPQVGEVAMTLRTIAAQVATSPQPAARALEQAWSVAEVPIGDGAPRANGPSHTAIGVADPAADGGARVAADAARIEGAYGPQGTVVGLGRVLAPPQHTSGRRLAMPLPATHASIAVLPLGYRGPADHDWLAEAISGELTDTLSRTRGLRVLGSGAVARVLADRDPRRICDELGIDHVVDGTMQIAGERVRVTVRLIDFEGAQRWTEKFDLAFGDLFELQERAGRRIVEALRLELTAFSGSDGAPPEAVERYLRARRILRAQLFQRCPEAVQLLEEALALAPGFASAQAAHALGCVLVWFFPDRAPARDWATITEAAVARALTSAPDAPESHLASARFRSHRGELAEAVASLRIALQLAPTAADVHYIVGQLECETGRVDEGLARLALATELEPTATTFAYERARIEALAGRREAFRASLDHVFKHSPGLAPTHLALREAAWARDEARLREVIEIGQTQLSPAFAPFLTAVARGHLGELTPHDVARALRPLLEAPINARLRALVLTNLAEVECAAGAFDESLATLRTLEGTLLYDLTWLERCRLLDPLRAKEGFLELVRTTRKRCDDVWSQPPGTR